MTWSTDSLTLVGKEYAGFKRGQRFDCMAVEGELATCVGRFVVFLWFKVFTVFLLNTHCFDN